MKYELLDLEGVASLAGRLAAELPSGTVVWLRGDLGAGKTTLVRSFVAARGCEVPAASPTYAISHRYPGERGDCWHVDCYRFESADEAIDVDWEAIADADATLIEWPEKAGSWAPKPDLTIELEHHDETSRRVRLSR